MIGTRILLMGLDGVPSASGNARGRVIGVSNHSIPPFWMLLFAPLDLQLLPLAENNQAYPVLIAPREQALARLRAVQLLLASLIDGDGQRLLQRWQRYIEETPDPVIALETYELWIALEQPASLAPRLRRQLEILAGLSDLAPDQRLAALVAADLHFGVSDQIRLAGYGWG